MDINIVTSYRYLKEATGRISIFREDYWLDISGELLLAISVLYGTVLPCIALYCMVCTVCYGMVCAVWYGMYSMVCIPQVIQGTEHRNTRL